MITGSPRKNEAFPTGIAVALAIVLVAGGGAWYLAQPRPSANQAPVLTPEAKDYVKNKKLMLNDVQLKATDSAMTKSLIEIVGTITNHGDRKLKLVELNCVFYDPYGQVVLRERVPIVRAKTGGLAPAETKSFRMPFDNMAGSWNQAMPQMIIAQLQFE